jgi:hypothetical protein
VARAALGGSTGHAVIIPETRRDGSGACAPPSPLDLKAWIVYGTGSGTWLPRR